LPPPPPPPPEGRAPSTTDADRARRDAVEDACPLSIVIEEGTLLAQKYRLARPDGFGGMAQLWVAKNEATGAEVCVKILVPDKSDDESVERFRREAHAAARLSHRAIVRIFDLVELGLDGEATKDKAAALAIVMELLHGETLGDYLMKRGKLPLDETIDIALPVLSALAHAHRAGVVHRDLKPDNIFLAADPDGHVIPKVLDFGVSKMATTGGLKLPRGNPLTLDGVMLGTPGFMSPEQARGARDVDARSDVFSGAILVYMMLAGKNPFESENFHSILAAVVSRHPPRLPGLPDAVWNVLEKSLSKDPALRYADATEQGIALRRATGRTSTTDSGVHSAQQLPASMRKLVVPLGGDSHVSVPPVGNAELGDASNESRRRTATPAARRRAIRIVVGVLAVSVAVMVVALLRGPTGSAASSNATASGDVSAAVASSVAPIVETPTIPATAATTASSTETGAGIGADAGVVAPKAIPAPKKSDTAVRPRSTGQPLAAPQGNAPKEPSIVRDPGF
jgi:serine/threonine protein kinase